MKIVGLEEHFATPELIDAWHALEPQWRDVALVSSADDRLARRLLDVDTERIAAMDDTGVDVAVAVNDNAGSAEPDTADAVALQIVCNDRLAEAVRRHPDRLQGFATLATPDPDAASAELGRAVTELGFNGAMLYGRTRDRNPSTTPTSGRSSRRQRRSMCRSTCTRSHRRPPCAAPTTRTRRRRRRCLGHPRTRLALRRRRAIAPARSSPVCSTAFPVCR